MALYKEASIWCDMWALAILVISVFLHISTSNMVNMPVVESEFHGRAVAVGKQLERALFLRDLDNDDRRV